MLRYIKSRFSKKFYPLSQFPYPSGNLHLGHTRVYAINDVITKWGKINNYDVINPIGFDSFGLPAENAANQNGLNPYDWTNYNIDVMKKQMKLSEHDFNWNKSLNTHEYEYYKWNQFIFNELYKKGLAYKKKSFVNFDPIDKTVLANEQVDANGFSWRSGAKVEKRLMDQWFFKITKYSDKLYNNLKNLDWPKSVIDLQKNWIGKSEGHWVKFNLYNNDKIFKTIDVFTTKIETINDCKFIIISPENEIFEEYKANNLLKLKDKLKYFNDTDRQKNIKELTIKLDSLYTKHPLTNENIPVFVSSFVFNEYATGFVMGVPTYDSRDKEIADKFSINYNIITNKNNDNNIVNNIIGNWENNYKNIIKRQTFYKLRDWLVSRQRYWGTPIPIINCKNCGKVLIDNIKLPEQKFAKSYLNGEYNIKCTNCGNNDAYLENNTLDTFVDSSWYYLRFLDNKNNNKIFDYKYNEYMPIDVYIGGLEHATKHLLYSRFINMFLKDIGITDKEEPFKKLIVQGLVKAKTYKLKSNGKYLKEKDIINYSKDDIEITIEKMSKSKYNGMDPLDLIEKYGLNSIKLALIFSGPLDSNIILDEKIIISINKFIEKNNIFFKNLKFELLNEEIENINLNFYKVKFEEIDFIFENNYQLNIIVARIMEIFKELKEDLRKNNALNKNILVMYTLLLKCYINLDSIETFLNQNKINFQKFLNENNKIVYKKFKNIFKNIKNEENIKLLINGKFRKHFYLNEVNEISLKNLYESYIRQENLIVKNYYIKQNKDKAIINIILKK